MSPPHPPGAPDEKPTRAKHPDLEAYLARYEAEHTKSLTRLTHVVGIPMILASLPMLVVDWRWGAGLFVGGWTLQLVGHRIEGNRPAFLGDPVYLLVGIVWVCREVVDWVRPRRS